VVVTICFSLMRCLFLQGPLQQRWKLGSSPFHELSNAGGAQAEGLSEHRLRDLTGNHPENPTLDLPCREVFASGQRSTEVVGPLLEDEAAAVHAGAWTK